MTTSVASRPFFTDTNPWTTSPDSSFVFRNREYTSATSALDDYINEFEQDPCLQKSWQNASSVGNLTIEEAYESMIKEVKQGSPEGKESPPKFGEITAENISKLPSTPSASRQKDDDAETTVTDLLIDPEPHCGSRVSPVGNSSSGGSSGKKPGTPDRPETPASTRSQKSGSNPRARRSLNSPLSRTPSPYSKLHTDLPVGVARDPTSPINRLKLPPSPLKQAEDFANVEIPATTRTPAWVHDITAASEEPKRDNLASKIPCWVNDIDISGTTGRPSAGSLPNLNISTASLLSSKSDSPKWLQQLETSDITAILNLIDKQLKNKQFSDSFSTISSSLSDEILNAARKLSPKRPGIPGRKIFWDAVDAPTRNKLLSLDAKDKIRQRLVDFDDHKGYRLKTSNSGGANVFQSNSSSSEDSLSGRRDLVGSRSRDFNPRSRSQNLDQRSRSHLVPRSLSVDRLSQRSVSEMTSDTDVLLAAKVPSRINSLNKIDSYRGLKSQNLSSRYDRPSDFKFSQLLTPPFSKKSKVRTLSSSAYDEFKSQASRAGRTSSPKKSKDMFLDDTSVYTLRKVSPRSERADKMIRNALATPLVPGGGSTTTMNTDSLLNAKISLPSSVSSSYTTVLPDNNYTPFKTDYPTQSLTGSMETLKNMLFTMQNVATNPASQSTPGSTSHDPVTKMDDFEDEAGGQSLQKAFMHLSKLKSLVSEDVPNAEELKTPST